MKAIEYDAGGLHLITGTCVGVDAGWDHEDSDFGYYTILSDHNDNDGYCITLNLPIGDMSPPNQYPKLNERVIIRAEGIEKVGGGHPQHRYLGYAEICQVSTEAEIREAVDSFEVDHTKSWIPILPKTLNIDSVLHLYGALNDEGREHFVRDCIHRDDQAFCHQVICEGFIVPFTIAFGIQKFRFVEWNIDTAKRAVRRDNRIGVKKASGFADLDKGSVLTAEQVYEGLDETEQARLFDLLTLKNAKALAKSVSQKHKSVESPCVCFACAYPSAS
jgi:hypothetical protein